jgi:hypothetical protein
MLAVAAALVAMLLPASVGTAAAKPARKPGTVKGLALTATKPGAGYQVHATWNISANATRYRVTMTSASGAPLASGFAPSNSYTAAVSLGVTSKVNVRVVPYNGNRKGKAGGASISLPDLTAPVAEYTLTPASSSDGKVTIERISISDDVSSDAAITQTITWKPGDTETADGSRPSFAHDYGPTMERYEPIVTVTDEAGNSRNYTLVAVVADTTVPTGSFTVTPRKAWARWTRVTLAQSWIHDDLSPGDAITRTVAWGDGTSSRWTSGTTAKHRYQKAGRYTPTVTLTDEASNSAVVAAGSAVTVAVDSVAPGLRLTVPKVRKASVRSWSTLKGHSRDAGVGVRKVRLRAIEKRGTVWYAYRPAKRVWVRGGKTATAAWVKSRPARVSTTPTHTWSVKLHRLTKGTLVYRVSSIDHLSNASKPKVHRQVLIRR